MLSIQFSRTGGPEVLEAVEVEVPSPAAGQILVRHAAVGLNYIDTYHRSGLYPLKLPSGIGLEAAGTVEAVGHSEMADPLRQVHGHGVSFHRDSG